MSLAPLTLYVGNLPFGASEADLRELFEVYGPVASVRLILDHRTGRFRGFGFVTFVCPEAAKRGAAEMEGRPLDGRPLKVSLAQPLREETAAPVRAAAAKPMDKMDLKRPLGPREDGGEAERGRRRALFEERLRRALRPPGRRGA